MNPHPHKLKKERNETSKVKHLMTKKGADLQENRHFKTVCIRPPD